MPQTDSRVSAEQLAASLNKSDQERDWEIWRPTVNPASDSRVRPDDLAGSWEAYPRNHLADTLRHAHGYGHNLPAPCSSPPPPPLAVRPRPRAPVYRWTDHERRLYWRAMINVAGVLLCILIALLWLLQFQASR